MKKLIVALVALSCVFAFSAETVRCITLTTTGTTTAIGTLTGKSNAVTYPLAVYQVVDTQTNTVTMTKVISGATDSYSEGSLTAVANTTGDQTVGAGDVSADVDDIVILSGDQFVLTGSGADATNVVYKVLIKEVSQ